MSIYKDNVTGKWRVVYRYTDWTGKTKQTSKRGFPTKREAQMWEHEQMLKHAFFYQFGLRFGHDKFDTDGFFVMPALHRSNPLL